MELRWVCCCCYLAFREWLISNSWSYTPGRDNNFVHGANEFQIFKISLFDKADDLDVYLLAYPNQ